MDEAPARAQAYAAVWDQVLHCSQEQPINVTFKVHTRAQVAARALGSGYVCALTDGISSPLGELANNLYYITAPTHVPFNPAPATLPPHDSMVHVESELAYWIAQGAAGIQDMVLLSLCGTAGSIDASSHPSTTLLWMLSRSGVSCVVGARFFVEQVDSHA
ncbi:hypothetical protein FRC08_016141 [Ceratobasidium sp. 394]|nr:hypothetical protein FRC08_016141 [Ceratobasidium sp. 394]KAG9097394.1 hypothetical protein FS749_006411 [Ceratobasidium sp. UAMH 11750]